MNMKLKKNKKGFTLVEVIVVLVILAILAAALIPTMLGFVNDAKGKALIAQARSAYVAAQMIATEGKAAVSGDLTADQEQKIESEIGSATGKMHELLADDVILDADNVQITGDVNAKGKVTSVKYTDKKEKKVVTITPKTGTTGGTAEVTDLP